MDTFKDVLTTHLNEAATLVRDIVLSRAWVYPLLGISYFVSHPNLYKAVAPVLLRALGTSFAITVAMFFFTYVPQLAFCVLFSGPLAFLVAALMVLSESFVLVMFVSKVFFLNEAQDRLCVSSSLSPKKLINCRSRRRSRGARIRCTSSAR